MRSNTRQRRPFSYSRRGRSRAGAGNITTQAAIMKAVRAADNPQVEQSEPFVATHSFADFAISDQLKQNIAAKGYSAPTPIQDQAIPAVLDGRDVIGIANTGTGKTAAFLIPAIEKLANDRNQRMLIITPTRELALQIGAELRDMSKGLRVRYAMLIGGVSSWKQRRDLNGGAQVVIGTPGRLKDMIQHRNLNLSQFRTVVLDEADRMVDIGFISDIKYFISLLPEKRQSLFFSATIGGKVATILDSFVNDAVTVSVKRQDAAKNVSQNIIEITNGKRKIDYLLEMLNQEGFDKVLVFGRTKWGIEKLTKELVSRGFSAGAIHGNKRQSQRERMLEQFKSNKIQVLLATDVASRGLDIDSVSQVINYDVPSTFDDYIHRIGRTGRADRVGAAYTFIDYSSKS